MQKLRVGVIGIGRYAAGTLVPAFRETGEAEIVAISRRNPELLSLAKTELAIPNAYEDWRDLLAREQLDAAVVSTSAGSHAEPTIAALERGLDVLVEKPMALTGSEASRMIEAAKKAGRLLMVGYTCRLHGQWRWARSLIQQGVLGRIRQVMASWCIDAGWYLNKSSEVAAAVRAKAKGGGMADIMTASHFDPGYWRFDPKEGGPGMLVDVGTHLFDLAVWLCGDKIARVYAVGSAIGRTTNISVLARLRSDVLCSLGFNDAVPGDGSMFWSEGKLSLWGDEGTLSADWGTWNPRRASVRILKRGVPIPPETAFKDITPAAGFVGAVRKGSPNPCPPEEAAQAVYLMEAALTSMEENRSIDL